MVSHFARCALCGLKIDGAGITRFAGGEEHRFCCEGCAQVYQIAHDAGLLEQVTGPSPPSAPLASLPWNPGESAYFRIAGMWCAGCATAAEQLLRKQPGVKDAIVSFTAERGRIRYDPASVDPERLMRLLEGLSYHASLVDDDSRDPAARAEQRLLLQLIAALAFGMQIMLLYVLQLYPLYAQGQYDSAEVRGIQYIAWILATPVLLFSGHSFLRGAWQAARAGTATMDTLVALGTSSAYGYSVFVTLRGGAEVYFDSVAMITTFVLLGRYLEALGGAAARKGTRALLSLQPRQARRRGAGGEWDEVDAGNLVAGDTILVRPGERVPADAEILEGAGSLNEALLTGESSPAPKQPGDVLLAGSTVLDAAFVARVVHAGAETRLSQITDLVERTLSSKPPVQRLADRASAYFTFGILVVAALCAAVRLAIGQPSEQALLAGVAVLVVACPCALGLATPLAMTTVLGRTSAEGLLVRNAGALEKAVRIDRVVFDKTGTLTRGELSVETVYVEDASGLKAGDLLCLAAAVEQYSEHPIGKAIVAACPKRPLRQASDFRSLPGFGASAAFTGAIVPGDSPDSMAEVTTLLRQRIMVGSDEFAAQTAAPGLRSVAEQTRGIGRTVVWVAVGAEVLGLIVLVDALNPSARDAVVQLRGQGVRAVVLSGDDPATVAAVAAELGLAEHEGRCSPADKAERIRSWQATSEQVCMTGDGVNDAPALAQADLSFTAVGGTDVAGETSDVLLMQADLTLIPWFLTLSRRTRQIIGENLAWAFAYNLVAVPLAAFGLISPVIAAAAMASSSLLVVANSLRLRSLP